MRWWKFFWKRSRPASRLDRELETELRFHIDQLAEEHLAAGMSPSEARRQAVLAFGSSEQLKENLRDVYRLATLETAIANFKSAFRLLRKSPAFSIAVILTLALGIGGNSAVFSAIDAVLLRPLPFPDGDRLLVLKQINTKLNSPAAFVAPARLEDWNRLNSTFEALTGYYTEDLSETSGALPQRMTQVLVAPRFLRVWGISPALGRGFTPQEEHFGGPRAALISDHLWHSHLNADPQVLGRHLHFSRSDYTIVGVMPPSFSFPNRQVDFWSPSPADAPYAQDRSSTWYQVFGRLKAGVSLAQARANLATAQSQLGRQFPATDADLLVDVEPLKEGTVHSVRSSLWIVFASVSLLLLIACTNIAALLLARTTARQREISIRYSLGASRLSVIAQLLTEAFVLSLAGAILGLALAAGATHVLRTLAQSLPRAEEITLDGRIVLYTFFCAAAVTLLCGLVPALYGTRRSLSNALARGSRTQVSGRDPLRWLLVGLQVSLAVTLLVGAGLLLRSFEALSRVSPGFDANRVLTLQISGAWNETADRKGLTRRIDRTLDALRALPGVEAAAISATLPGVPGNYQTGLQLVERQTPGAPALSADSRFVSAGYFSVLKIPLLEGEVCRTGISGVVVNRSFIDAYLDGRPALGMHLALAGDNPFLEPAVIRGVVGDAREQGLNNPPSPTAYWCTSAPTPAPFYLIRTIPPPLSLGLALRQAIHKVEPARSVFEETPLTEILYTASAQNRLRTRLLSLFGLLAIALASVGLYGTLAYLVTVRRREVGLRMALGALRGRIIRHFFLQGMLVSLVGCVAGVLIAAAFTRLLSGMLYEVSTADPVTFSGVVALVLTVAVIASLLPALRAARVDPMRVLREE